MITSIFLYEKIDGITYNFSEATDEVGVALCYDSINSVTLENGVHQVTITNKTYNNRCEVDAIDIPDTGSLVNPVAPTPSPTPAPDGLPDLCYDNSIANSLDTYNPGTISSNSQSTQSFTVTGAQLGDFVQVSFDQDL